MNDERKIFDLYLELTAEVVKPVMHEYPNGARRWMLKNGDYHREDGPAIERANGEKFWWLHGILYYTPETWAEDLLKERNQPHDAAAIDAFLKTILKKDTEQAL